jgi:hypothetical protein
MENKKTTLRDQLLCSQNGIILGSDGEKDGECWNFYDWFCQDTSLERKSRALMSKVKTFVSHYNIDLDSTYVFFKNNCPMNGSLYDDFRICDIETGDVLYTVIPKTGHWIDKPEESATIYSKAHGFSEPLKQARSFRELFK